MSKLENQEIKYRLIIIRHCQNEYNKIFLQDEIMKKKH